MNYYNPEPYGKSFIITMLIYATIVTIMTFIFMKFMASLEIIPVRMIDTFLMIGGVIFFLAKIANLDHIYFVVLFGL